MRGLPHIGRWLAAAVLVVAPCLQELTLVSAQVAPTNPYVDAEDTRVVEAAAEAVVTYCAGGFKGELDDEARGDGRKALADAVGDNNVILQILKESDSNADVAREAREKLSPGWLIVKGSAVVMAVILLALWFCCCWTSCPCCRCCRCCGKRTELRVVLKVLVLLAILGLFGGLIACVVLADHGFYKAKDGFENAACTTAKILNTSLGGQGGTMPFIGMMGVLDSFWTLDKKLDDGSTFLVDINGIMAKTDQISKATTVASGTLELLKNVLSYPANVRPKLSDGTDLLHDCQLCSGIAPTLGVAVGVLRNGVAVALAGARSQVEDQLSPSSRQALQQTLRTSAEPMLNFKTTIRDTFSFFVDKDKFNRIQDIVNKEVFGSVVGLLTFAFLLFGCAFCSSIWYTVRERSEGDPAGDQKLNPYHKGVHRCACCAWHCGFLYSIIAFLLGGVIVAIGAPLGSMCLIMDDMNRQLISDIAPALGMNLTGDSGDMLLGIVDSCLASQNSSLNANLLDIIYNRVAVTNEKLYLREEIVGNVKAPVDAAFDAISTSLAQSPSGIANSPMITDLRDIFGSNDIRALMIADENAMMADPTLSILAQDTRGTSGVAVGYATSVLCADHVVQGPIGNLAGTTSPGITGFAAKLAALGPVVPDSSTCAQKVACAPGLSTPAQICRAGNAFLDLQRSLEATTTFRCDLFEDPSNPLLHCDPLAMTQGGAGSGSWSGDCLFPDGSLRPKQKLCSLAQFATYMQEYDLRIKKVMDRLDRTVATTMDTINIDLRSVMNVHMVDVIEGVADGITCGFLPPYYHEMVDVMCYQGVWGLQILGNIYVVSAVLVVFLMLLMYIIWRLSIDNVNLWDKENIIPMTSVLPMEHKDLI